MIPSILSKFEMYIFLFFIKIHQTHLEVQVPPLKVVSLLTPLELAAR